MKHPIIVTAPQGTGKTRYAQQLADALDRRFVLDEFDGSQPLRPDTLALTHIHPDELDVPPHVEIVALNTADQLLRLIGRSAEEV
ncbi:hypothetical protein GPA19_08125 [Azoarcus indigens]|uniref:AAA domain-containing protein n=1 Tax=Azoarcus indigens TaxID=29545 RepID=A0A4R6E105_9RHOO|nr:hypothetical protein [Azoarcus indigens]NMG64911.1 hypothetical protein [Azoarcus indigens]TDN50448.1 hypothetical protein C7389_109142 [Azoarcus indigens]